MANPVAVIIGGTRGIGLAMGKQWLQSQLKNNVTPRLFIMGRNVDVKRNQPLESLIQQHNNCDIHPISLDLTDPQSIEQAARIVSINTETVDYMFHTAGMLHNNDESGKLLQGMPSLPERSFKEMTLEGMKQTFSLNTFAPALVIKEFSPILKKSSNKGYRYKESSQPPVFAAISARVGSIEDNKKGGWTSYRASKAALNMILQNAHWEFGMGGKQKIIVMALHPGTVDTNLSKPFQEMAKKQYEIFPPEKSAEMLVKLCVNSKTENSGGFYAYDGSKIPW